MGAIPRPVPDLLGFCCLPNLLHLLLTRVRAKDYPILFKRTFQPCFRLLIAALYDIEVFV